LPYPGCAILGEHPGPSRAAQVLGLQVPAHGGRVIPRGDHVIPAGDPGRALLPAHQVAVHGAGRGTGPQEQRQVNILCMAGIVGTFISSLVVIRYCLLIFILYLVPDAPIIFICIC